MATSTKLMVCVHGHFYQPPRENPWLEDLEREPTAAPHHNWNSRIAEECYTPNAWARVLDKDGRVVRLYDNYTRLSFNVGPTLVTWLARHSPETLDAMIAADRESVVRLGQGNAIAQVYNHMIMPLCSARDAVTQVRWGLTSFARTFSRRARGMWLAETAVDDRTLDVLAAEGVDFTILSPFQATRFRVDGGDWTDCAHGSIPSGRAYRYTTANGRTIALFFYDGGIARGIAFESLLRDAAHLVGAFDRAWEARTAQPGEPWLVHTATDGESYGHHSRFGEMALAAAWARLDQREDVEVVNYATFLDLAGCRGDVELLPVSAWSCSHGVGRWERDCGCRLNPQPTWNQRWRTGLRIALNALRDGLATAFERETKGLLLDPWQARDASIALVETQWADAVAVDAFLQAHASKPLSRSERRRVLVLLEMQRCSLLMFTSCGWFFDDVAGQETVILLRYAARALSLLRALDEDDADRLQGAFELALAQTESNVRRSDGRPRTGRDVFRDEALTAAIGPDRIAVSLALTCATGSPAPVRTAAWRIVEHEEAALDDKSQPCVVGRVGLVDVRVDDRHDIGFVVVDFGGIDLRGVLVPPVRLDALHAALASAVDASELSRVLDDAVDAGGRGFSMRDAPLDLRNTIAERALARRVAVTDAVLSELLLSERGLLRSVVAMGGVLPSSLKSLLAHALSHRARTIVDELVSAEGSIAPLIRRLQTVMTDAASFGVTLDVDATVRFLEGAAATQVVRVLGANSHAEQEATLQRAIRLCSVLEPIAGDRPLLRLVKAASALSMAGRAERVVPAQRALLPLLNRVCRSAFPLESAAGRASSDGAVSVRR
jgi:alpha-amylase/alpha-mannosidase (GH57 family)